MSRAWLPGIALLGIALLDGCSAPPPKPARAPARVEAPVASVISIHRPGAARRREGVDAQRVAELEAMLREDRGGPVGGAPAAPRPRGNPDADLVSMDTRALIEALDAALDRAEAAEAPGQAADEPALREAERELSALSRRLHAIANRLFDQRDATLRELARRHTQADAPLAEEEARLLRRSTAVVIGPDHAFVDDPEEELEEVRAERAELLAEHQARVKKTDGVYLPLTEDAALGRSRVGKVHREVLRRLAALDPGAGDAPQDE